MVRSDSVAEHARRRMPLVRKMAVVRRGGGRRAGRGLRVRQRGRWWRLAWSYRHAPASRGTAAVDQQLFISINRNTQWCIRVQ